MKLNVDQCHLLVFRDKGIDVSLNIGGVNIKESKEEKFLGVIVEKETMLERASEVYLQEGSPKATSSLENLSLS